MGGRVLELNGALEKNNTGVDLRQLFIGSEGTLGVITEATLKLVRLPTELSVFLFAVPDLAGVLRLFREATPLQLSSWADAVRRRLHPDDLVTYVIGRNINYTNVCWVQCKFCNFYRLPGADGGYVLPQEGIFAKIRELMLLGGTEILIQGGLNPALRIEYFEETFRAIKANFPVHIHGLSPAEIIYLARISGLDERDCLMGEPHMFSLAIAPREGGARRAWCRGASLDMGPHKGSR